MTIEFDTQKEAEQLKRIQEARARVRDIDAKEAWLKQQFAASGESADYDNWQTWMQANSDDLEQQWQTHCGMDFVPEVLPSEDHCGT